MNVVGVDACKSSTTLMGDAELLIFALLVDTILALMGNDEFISNLYFLE